MEITFLLFLSKWVPWFSFAGLIFILVKACSTCSVVAGLLYLAVDHCFSFLSSTTLYEYICYWCTFGLSSVWGCYKYCCNEYCVYLLVNMSMSSVGNIPRGEMARCDMICVLGCNKWCQAVLQSGCTYGNSYHGGWELCHVMSYQNLATVRLFHLGHSLHCGFDLIFLDY